MTPPRRDARKKPRVTEEQIDDIRRLYNEGIPMSEIATRVGVHRHTVAARIVGKRFDLIADGARKQVLAAELTRHFSELNAFVREDIRKFFNASAPGAIHITGKITTAGLLAIPHSAGAAHYTTGEWIRMYAPLPRDQHLLRALREHTGSSKLWMYWDRWRKQTASFRSASQAFCEKLGMKLENEPPTDIRYLETVRSWVFGNLIKIASGKEPDGVETLMQSTTPDGISPVVYSNPSDLSRLAERTLEEARNWPELDTLKSAMAELAGNEIQSELRRLAGQIDFELVGIGLMSAFGGSCHLCPS